VTSNDDYVLQVLQEQGLVTPELIDQAAMSLKEEGETVVDQLVKTGVISEEDLLHLLAAQFGMEVVHIDPAELDIELREVLPA
jgi:type IV pilus assembly protein PilB